MVLGLEWDTIADEFLFRFDDLLSKCSAMEQTKRNLLSVSASIYDPLGLIAPITARIKTIFQILCKDKLNWDDIISPNIALVWNKFLEEVKRLREIRLLRCVFDLHFPSQFRIELLLLGCLLLSRLIKKVLEGLAGRLMLVIIIYCWSDSKVALCWIQGKEKSWKAWVENRVVSIRSVVGRGRWCFVKGEINPADVPTRISAFLVLPFSCHNSLSPAGRILAQMVLMEIL